MNNEVMEVVVDEVIMNEGVCEDIVEEVVAKKGISFGKLTVYGLCIAGAVYGGIKVGKYLRNKFRKDANEEVIENNENKKEQKKEK